MQPQMKFTDWVKIHPTTYTGKDVLDSDLKLCVLHGKTERDEALYCAMERAAMPLLLRTKSDAG